MKRTRTADIESSAYDWRKHQGRPKVEKVMGANIPDLGLTIPHFVAQ